MSIFKDREDFKKVQAQYVEKHADVRAMLQLPAGRKLLDEMAKMFDEGDLMGRSPEETYFNLGRRAVVRWLRDLRDFNVGTGDE